MKRREALQWTVWTAGISSLPISLAALQSCKPTGDPGWTPSYLNLEEAQMINNIANIILPTDKESPGAAEVHCPEFVDLIVRDCLSSTEKKEFRDGLQIIKDDYQKSVKASVTAGITGDMQRYFAELDYNSYNGQDALINQTFRKVKQMVVLGYFTSETVMRNHLDYHAIPGEYRGCINTSQETKAYVDDNVAG
ncbi:MAG: gluconate 2-dehydrogenase subunit 3 family protein [Saprospiraceae bacterium]|nr:gluconate 2-dehydrogenase subunit 3 family protein [Saprospiraceae bacterium]